MFLESFLGDLRTNLFKRRGMMRDGVRISCPLKLKWAAIFNFKFFFIIFDKLVGIKIGPRSHVELDPN